jgi:RHS repeat-associated protein
MRYLPWGETRFTSGTTPTSYRYTGQRAERGLGLYDYKARFYDPSLGRFIQADSIIPQQQGVQAWDRYAGMGNNPVRFNDPSGHSYCDSVNAVGEDCDGSSEASSSGAASNGNDSGPDLEDAGDGNTTVVATTLTYDQLVALAQLVERDAWVSVGGAAIFALVGLGLAEIPGAAFFFSSYS